MFLLQCEHLFTPSNSTLAVRLFATSEATLYRSYSGFSEQMYQVASTAGPVQEKEHLFAGRPSQAVAHRSL